MTDDLVKRLRGRRMPYDCGQFTVYDPDPDCNAAADRIEELGVENEQLRAALLDLIEHCYDMEKQITENGFNIHYSGESSVLIRARAAIDWGKTNDQ